MKRATIGKRLAALLCAVLLTAALLPSVTAYGSAKATDDSTAATATTDTAAEKKTDDAGTAGTTSGTTAGTTTDAKTDDKSNQKDAVREEYERLQQQINGKRQEMDDLKNQLNQIKGQKASTQQKKNLLDQRNAALQEEITLLEEQIDVTTRSIAANEELEKHQTELFHKQIRAEEEQGTISYWSVLFKATGFADLLSRMDFINEIVEHDQSVIDQLRTLRQQLAQDKADLEQQQAELTASKTELDAQVAEATRVFEEYAASEAGQQALLNQQAAREKELQEEIRKSEEANRNNQTAVGGFIWPTACRLITGGYGGRDAPCPGASTYHLGVDIGASWGSDIYATKAGTVMLANEGWNYGLGYCVKIQHDDGTSTVYGHMSRVIAVTGQRVAQGQVIGKIGSTGVSTGPHLHYEIRIGGVNGTAVNPLPYLPGYVRYGW